MAGGVVIQKAVIEVKFDDLKKAQLALKSTGVEMVHFGETAKKSGKGTDKAARSIGDLSEMLDKKLEKGLGRAFKATDRLNGIIGQIGAVGAIAGVAIGALAAAYTLLKSKSAEATKQLDEAKRGLYDQAAAAAIATSAVNKAAEANARNTLQLIASAKAEIVLAKSKELAKVVHEKQLALESELVKAKEKAAKINKNDSLEAFTEHSNAVNRIKQLKARTADAAKATVAAFAQIGQASSDLRAENKKTFVDTLPKWMQKGVQSAKQTAADITTSYKQVEYDVTNAFEAWVKSANKGQKSVGHRAKKTQSAWDDLIASAQLAPGLMGAAFIQLQQEIAESDRIFAESKAFAEPIAAGIAGEVDALSAALDDLGAAFKGVDTSAKPFAANLSEVLVPLLDATGEAALSSAFDALVYGESFAGQLNDFAEAEAKTAAISAAMELAKGLALSLINPPAAGAHFAAAAAFGSAAVLAGGVAMATGGFNGPSDAGGAGGAEDTAAEGDAFTGGGDTGQDRTEGGTQETVINVNLTAGSRPLLRIEQAQMAQELRGIMGA